MTVDPPTYTCPDHNVDLTALVKEALEDDAPSLAYPRPRLLGRAALRPRPFEVTVTCPGTPGAEPHDLICAGTRSR